MKVITWNCNMAFRKKAAFILEHKPDILVVPECEHSEKLIFPPGLDHPKDMLWFGENKNKGIGIFSYSDFSLELMPTYNPTLKMIIPVAVKGGPFDFTLYAIWANNPNDPDGQYIEQVWKALHHYQNQLSDARIMLVGDFNSNTIWDRTHRIGNHSDVVKWLEERGIFSAYHIYHKQTQGTERHPTLYMYRHEDKPYHIDYCFVSSDLIEKLQSVEIGEYQQWKQHSDHAPIIVTFSTI